ncbi:hypothetical protein FF1_019052 [Malus domestica]
MGSTLRFGCLVFRLPTVPSIFGAGLISFGPLLIPRPVFRTGVSILGFPTITRFRPLGSELGSLLPTRLEPIGRLEPAFVLSLWMSPARIEPDSWSRSVCGSSVLCVLVFESLVGIDGGLRVLRELRALVIEIIRQQ